MAAAAWRMAEAREEEHHLRPNMPSSIPSTGECNVKCRSVCVSVRVCVCLCVVVSKRAYEGLASS